MGQTTSEEKLRVLLVPDTIYWITGTIAKQIAMHNAWVEATICSSVVVDRLLEWDPSFIDRIDVAHFIDASGSRKLLPRFRGRVPCITTVHHVHEWSGVDHNQDADAVMVVSEEWRKNLMERGVEEDRLVWVPNGVDADVFCPPSSRVRKRARRRLGIHRDAFAIGYFAKKSSDAKNRKGVDIFTAGVVEMAKHHSNVVAVVAGPGWKDMIAELRSKGVECIWLPFVVDHEDLAGVYQALDTYWVTARIEGGPVTLLEAMSTGVACVSTPVGVAREIVEDGVTGFMTPIEDVDMLVKRTVELARDNGLRERIGLAGREAILSGYQWKQTTKRVRELYDVARDRFTRTADAQVRQVDGSLQNGRTNPDFGPFPLNAVAPRYRRWVRMHENLFWLNSGDVKDSRQAVMKLSLRACRANPLHARPWGRLLQSISPPLYRTIRRVWRLLKGLGAQSMRAS